MTTQHFFHYKSRFEESCHIRQAAGKALTRLQAAWEAGDVSDALYLYQRENLLGLGAKAKAMYDDVIEYLERCGALNMETI